jgi:uncharacterized protein (DUF952 family)
MLLHIVKRDAWVRAVAAGSYAAESLHAEGFIHCSTERQVLRTAQRFYAGQRDLLLLAIAARRLTSELRYEAPHHPPANPDDRLFPHIYGPLNVDAVDEAYEFPCEEDGTFRLPPQLAACTEGHGGATM